MPEWQYPLNSDYLSFTVSITQFVFILAYKALFTKKKSLTIKKPTMEMSNYRNTVAKNKIVAKTKLTIKMQLATVYTDNLIQNAAVQNHVFIINYYLSTFSS